MSCIIEKSQYEQECMRTGLQRQQQHIIIKWSLRGLGDGQDGGVTTSQHLLNFSLQSSR